MAQLNLTLNQDLIVEVPQVCEMYCKSKQNPSICSKISDLESTRGSAVRCCIKTICTQNVLKRQKLIREASNYNASRIISFYSHSTVAGGLDEIS